MTSPPLTEPRSIQIVPLIVFYMNFTEPSPNRALTPPG
jgi:hypothetical protein